MADDRPPLEMPTFSLRRRMRVADDDDTPPLGVEPPPPGVVQPPPASEPGPRRLPAVQVSGPPAAALTGVAVGGLAVLLAWLAGVGCEAVRGTSACGGGPGLLILLVVLAALTWAGSLLLRVLGVPHPGSTSLLAVGILAVLVLVCLLGSLDEAWALVAVPVASAISYAVSWWVTAAVGDDDPAAGTSPGASSYDVR
jgi:hypothetical protein